jgi:histidinol-phosphate aminotransferase
MKSLGVSFASKEISQIFNNTKAPYNISTPTSLLARAALQKQGVEKMQSHVENIIKERDYIMTQLKHMKRIGRILGRNNANFILVEILNSLGHPCNDAASQVYTKLAETEGIVVRFRGKELGCFGCLRMTIGTREENDFLLQKLAKLLQ